MPFGGGPLGGGALGGSSPSGNTVQTISGGWGRKWGKNPITLVHTYWGRYKNEIVSQIALAQAMIGTDYPGGIVNGGYSAGAGSVNVSNFNGAVSIYQSFQINGDPTIYTLIGYTGTPPTNFQFYPPLAYNVANGTPFTIVPCDTAYIAIPTLGSVVTTTLTYPYVSPSRTVALRNPEFGDQLTVETEAIIRRNRAKELQAFKDANWPTFKSFKITIRKLKTSDIAAFVAFIQASFGQYIGLLDYLNRQWKGFITTEDLDVIQLGQDSTCNFEITFTFLGTLQ